MLPRYEGKYGQQIRRKPPGAMMDNENRCSDCACEEESISWPQALRDMVIGIACVLLFGFVVWLTSHGG